LKPKVIAVVGAKKVGKTTTTENLIAELIKRGYKVAAIKHISEPQWTIDTPGKDTYRFGQKGANPIIVLAPNETVTIQKGATEKTTLTTLLKKATDTDVVLTEGFKKTVAKRTTVPKIAVVTTKEQAQQAQKTYKPILAFSGPFNTHELFPATPYINGLTEPGKLADLTEEKILKNKK
jgi:molybdopterin-guanine dinucleotide biosynthesis protein B